MTTQREPDTSAEVEAMAGPVAWARAVHTPSSPSGPGEYDLDLCAGEDHPGGDGWFPLYQKAAPVPLARDVSRFKRDAPEDRATIREDATATLPAMTSYEMINQKGIPTMEGLETTEAERESWAGNLPNIPLDLEELALGRLARDFIRIETDAKAFRDFLKVADDRAEGLAKEVERLQRQIESFEADADYHRAQRETIKRHEDQIRDLKVMVSAAEAKLAVYEAPIGDGEVERKIKAWEAAASLPNPDKNDALTPAIALQTVAILKTALADGAVLLRRLSATIAQRDAEITKLREAGT